MVPRSLSRDWLIDIVVFFGVAVFLTGVSAFVIAYVTD
jgi:hypothetical protein